MLHSLVHALLNHKPPLDSCVWLKDQNHLEAFSLSFLEQVNFIPSVSLSSLEGKDLLVDHPLKLESRSPIYAMICSRKQFSAD